MGEVQDLTAAYESWTGSRIPLDAGELARKHAEMAAHELRFLRGTYYLWLVRIAELVPDALTGPRAPVVGDLHVENFGTWRDDDQVRRWGVNDLDELEHGPVLPDLVRLAVSAVLAPHLALGEKDVAAIVLDTWATATPGASVDLAEPGAGHLRKLVPEFADPKAFYAKLATGAPAEVPADVAAAATAIAEKGWHPAWHVHEAGTGSLGHRRAVGVGPAADGTPHAREAKQLGPGTSAWLRDTRPGTAWPEPDPALFEQVRTAVRGPAAARRVADWHVRDLAPDVVRIELAGQDKHDSERLLRAMARATADVHGTDPAAFHSAVEAAGRLPDHWFRDAVSTMAESTRADHAAYRG